MTGADAIFTFLVACTRPVGRAEDLHNLAAAVTDWDVLVDSAEHHGMEMLVSAHLRANAITIPQGAEARLRGRWLQQSHAHAVRALVTRQVVGLLDATDAHALVLKGAALGPLVYDDPVFRPMRDLDLLVSGRRAAAAFDVLLANGFTESASHHVPSYHHLPGLWKEVDGVIVTVELHTRLLRDTAFLPAITYEDVANRSWKCERHGLTLRTMDRTDLLSHVYAHGFAINVLNPAIRLISVADLIHATEAWIDDIDWVQLTGRSGRLVRALATLGQLTPWSPRVADTLWRCTGVAASRVAVRPLSSGTSWRRAAAVDVVWPPDWWFRMRYGIAGTGQWLWYRIAGHPVRLMLAGADTAAARVSKRWRPRRPHHLLAHRSSNLLKKVCDTASDITQNMK
jgi:hypothetical protein